MTYFFKKRANLGLFLVYFRLFHMKQFQNKSVDGVLGTRTRPYLDGGRRRIH